MPARRLVGRAGEIAVLERGGRRSAAGEFRVVLVLADSGIGKTHLARTFLERPQAHHRSALGPRLPAWRLQVVRRLVAGARGPPSQADRGRGDGLCGGYLDDLAALAHTVATARGGAPAHEPSRRRLLQGLAVALANLAGNVCLRSWKRSGRILAVV